VGRRDGFRLSPVARLQQGTKKRLDQPTINVRCNISARVFLHFWRRAAASSNYGGAHAAPSDESLVSGVGFRLNTLGVRLNLAGATRFHDSPRAAHASSLPVAPTKICARRGISTEEIRAIRTVAPVAERNTGVRGYRLRGAGAGADRFRFDGYGDLDRGCQLQLELQCRRGWYQDQIHEVTPRSAGRSGLAARRRANQRRYRQRERLGESAPQSPTAGAPPLARDSTAPISRRATPQQEEAQEEHDRP